MPDTDAISPTARSLPWADGVFGADEEADGEVDVEVEPLVDVPVDPLVDEPHAANDTAATPARANSGYFDIVVLDMKAPSALSVPFSLGGRARSELSAGYESAVPDGSNDEARSAARRHLRLLHDVFFGVGNLAWFSNAVAAGSVVGPTTRAMSANFDRIVPPM